MNLFQRHPITGLLPISLFLFFDVRLFDLQIKRICAEDQQKGCVVRRSPDVLFQKKPRFMIVFYYLLAKIASSCDK